MDLDAWPYPKTPLVPLAEIVHERMSVEIFRGCTRGCRFCQAGMITRPVRERTITGIGSMVEQGLKATGYEEVGLLSLSSAIRRASSPFTWSASTWATKIPTRASTRRCTTAGFGHGVKVNIHWVEAEALEEPGGEHLLDGAHGILVPGGFGNRGTRGMMRAAEVARSRGIPYFGICYGFQWAAVEYARNVCGLTEADSTECAPDTPHNIIYKLRDLLGVDDLGGTMRLGSYECELQPGSLAHRIYGTTPIHERHRHRYEFNCLYERALADKGLLISGRSPDGKFVEIVELPGHPWYVAVQFHPEFKSKPLAPHPLFASFVAASYAQKLAGAPPRRRQDLPPDVSARSPPTSGRSARAYRV